MQPQTQGRPEKGTAMPRDFPLTGQGSAGHKLTFYTSGLGRETTSLRFSSSRKECQVWVGRPAGGPHTYPASQPSQRSKRSSRSLRPHTSQKVGSSSSSSLALAFSTGIFLKILPPKWARMQIYLNIVRSTGQELAFWKKQEPNQNHSH